ncbi:hypothetical protein AAVH_16576 [Aphelenchoides avenae]|nr:hypothetical protein AAVH_16576 [Aphelenchus avenae]
MASTLSHSAIHRIISLVLGGPKWYPSYTLKDVHSKWKAIHDLYTDVRPVPPLDYLDSLELALVLKGQVDDEDVRDIFAHGKPLKFWGCPPQLVPKIVEAFRELHEEPASLDVTITALHGLGATSPSEAWPQVYATHLPCSACSSVQTIEERRITRGKTPIRVGFRPGGAPVPREAPVDPNKAVDFAVETFHISSKRFRKRLTLELHYELIQGTTAIDREQSSLLQKITIQLSDETCSAQGGLCGTSNRSSATHLLLPDFASEVFGFLDRVHVGTSLLANRDLYGVICQLKQRLPVHHLTCAFVSEMRGGRCVRWFSGFYWVEIRHLQRDLSYADMRRFKIPSPAGVEGDCDLIRHYLSNSHVADLQPPGSCFPFSIKMLAALASRNFSVGSVCLRTDDDARLSDYRSMDAIFGGMRLSSLDLSCEESRFVELVKTTDFYRTPTAQRLRELALTLRKPRNKEDQLGADARSNSPLWLSGICLLRNCAFYRVNYGPDRHLQTIERRMVRMCEDFERGKISDIAEHFQLKTPGIDYAFRRDNLLVAGMKVDGKKHQYGTTSTYEWDVYRFRNAATNDCLTACVAHYKAVHFSKTLLHISKGEVFPDASFADF